MDNHNQYPVTQVSFDSIDFRNSYLIDDRTAAAVDFPGVSVEVISSDSDHKVLEDAVKEYLQYREDENDHINSLLLGSADPYSEEQEQRYRDFRESAIRRQLDNGGFLLRVVIGGVDNDSVSNTMRSYYAYCKAITEHEEKNNGRVNLWKLRY